MKLSNQRQTHAFGQSATGYVQTIYLDLKFNYVRGSVEQIIIAPDAPSNWESETCKLIPYVWYEYTRVSKSNPESSGSFKARLNRIRKKVEFFARTETKNTVLRVIRSPVVIEFDPHVIKSYDIKLWYLEESYVSFLSDPLALSRKTRDMPPHLKEIEKAIPKNRGSKPNGRRLR